MARAGRVIAGSARGRTLVAPGSSTRPFADRVKQTLFDILEPDLAGAIVLDLYAGSGAAGIEALSRGAARCVFVERDVAALKTIQENLVRSDLAGERAKVVRGDVLAYLRGSAALDGPFGIVVVDPPYAEQELLLATLRILGHDGAHTASNAVSASDATQSLLTPGARVVAKHFWRDRPPEQIGLLGSERERRFGETALTFYRRRTREDG